MAGRDEFVNSIIGEGSSFSGVIEMRGLLRIDGDFSGTIKRADKVLISKTGRVKSSIRARVVVIGGAVQGDVIADERVSALSTSIVIGSVKTPILVAEEGVLIHGYCEVNEHVMGGERSVEELPVESQSGSLFTVDWQKLGSK